jgi:glycosyltransferase involved in cell wall biosynthesis
MFTDKKNISIVTPCYNEEDNIKELYSRIKNVMSEYKYDYEHIFIDNCSTDNSIDILKNLAINDKKLKLIINSRNFGHIRSPYYGLLQAKGDAVILLASDLQDPPELINEFIYKWERGFKIVLAVKPESEESFFMFNIRKIYYKFLSKISDVKLINNATGAGLFDKIIIDNLKKIDDPYPYFRGLISEIGFPLATIPFKQPKRKHGITKNNFYTLYDLAILGVTNHSKIPLRIMTFSGFILSILSLLVAVLFLLAKILYWDSFQLGIAPVLIGIFFFGAVQAFFIGLLGEYIGSIHTHVRKLPLVIESERINFE